MPCANSRNIEGQTNHHEYMEGSDRNRDREKIRKKERGEEKGRKEK